MQPVFLEIGAFTLHWYGILFAGGFFAAAVHWSLLSRRIGMPPIFGVELCVWVMISAVLGARGAYLIANWSWFIEDPARMLRIDQGGLIFYGGLIGSTIAVVLLARLRRIPVWQMADFTIGAVPLGHAIGRVGCLMNGCCYGAVNQNWWAIPLHDAMRHPVQVVEATFNLVLYIMLFEFARHKHREGRVFAFYLMLYPAGRFALEYLRGDQRMEGLFFNVSQELSLLMMVMGAVLWFTLPRKRHHNHRHAHTHC